MRLKKTIPILHEPLISPTEVIQIPPTIESPQVIEPNPRHSLLFAKPAPAPKLTKQVSNLIIAGKAYRVEAIGLVNMLTSIFSLTEDPEGDIILESKTYRCESDSVRQCLEKFVFYFLGGAYLVG